MPRRSAVRTPLIAVESIPPLDPYLARSRAAPADHAAQLAFAAVLFEREVYYAALTGEGTLHPGRAVPDAAWQPYPPTAARADVFGLKPEALDRLRATCRPIRTHAVATLLASAYAADLGRFEDARELALAVAARAAAPRTALARAFAPSVALAAGGDPVAVRAHRALESRVRRTFGDSWMNGLTLAREAHDQQVRQLAWRVRAGVEGPAFTRFLKTQAELCTELRDQSLAGIDPRRVPPALRPLLPLARRYGVGDDPCRAFFIATASPADRADAVRRVSPHLGAIAAWIAQFEPGAYPPEVAAFFWLAEAIDEIRRP